MNQKLFIQIAVGIVLVLIIPIFLAPLENNSKGFLAILLRGTAIRLQGATILLWVFWIMGRFG